jgi:hypothetical protein
MTTQQRIAMVPDILTHDQYRLLFTLFHVQRVRGEISEGEYQSAVETMVSEDLYGDRWTYAPAEDRWYRLEKGSWERGEPRGPLIVPLPAELAAALDDLSAELRKAEESVPSPRGKRHETSWRLAVLSGPNVGTSLRLGKRVRIGRSRAAEIRVNDSHVSRFHAELWRADGAYVIADQGSSHGTLVNDAPIDRATLLSAGDTITVGRTRFMLLDATRQPPGREP